MHRCRSGQSPWTDTAKLCTHQCLLHWVWVVLLRFRLLCLHIKSSSTEKSTQILIKHGQCQQAHRHGATGAKHPVAEPWSTLTPPKSRNTPPSPQRAMMSIAISALGVCLQSHERFDMTSPFLPRAFLFTATLLQLLLHPSARFYTLALLCARLNLRSDTELFLLPPK